jgi:hypothetical protein
VEVPTSFETIGHIAHLNLRAEHEQYKHIIGQVILDKNAHIQTVVNKVGVARLGWAGLVLAVLPGRPTTHSRLNAAGTPGAGRACRLGCSEQSYGPPCMHALWTAGQLTCRGHTAAPAGFFRAQTKL